jgi:hypothetical protein
MRKPGDDGQRGRDGTAQFSTAKFKVNVPSVPMLSPSARPGPLAVIESPVLMEGHMSRFKPLMIVLIFLAGFSLRAQLSQHRPGDEPYTPSKLEWAALELQASYGNPSWTNDEPVQINYIDSGDGATVLCILQYPPEVTAQLVKLNRDTAQKVFDKFVEGRGWKWVKIRFDERVLHVR